MASPLTAFRKNQKVLLAVFGILIMFVFTVGGSITMYQSSQMASRENSDYTVVSYRGGELTRNELNSLFERHAITTRFLVNLWAYGQGPDADQQRAPVSRAQSAEQALYRQLRSQQAEELGIVISDDAIWDYLARLSNDKLSRDKRSIPPEVMQPVTSRSMSQDALFDQIRQELLFEEMNNLAMTGVASNLPTPGEVWSYNNRFTRKISAEVLPVEVEQFRSQVKGQPTQQELRKLYEKYKFYPPNPESENPGFGQPLELAFSYVQADYDTFLTAAKKQVTAEAVQAEYEQRIARGDYQVTAPTVDESELNLGGDPPTPDPTAPPAPDASAPPAPDASAPPAPDASAPPAPEKPADEPKADEPKADEPKADEPNGDEQSSLRSSDDRLFVRFEEEPVDEADEPKTEEPKTEEPKTEEPKTEEPKTEEPKTEEPKTEKPKTEEPKTEEPKTEEPKTEEPKDPAEGGETPIPPTIGDPGSTAEEPVAEKKVRPLSEVEDEIRTHLARDLAMQSLDAELDKVKKAVRKYGTEVKLAQAQKQPLPKPLQLDAFSGPGISAGRIPLSTRLEAQESVLGKLKNNAGAQFLHTSYSQQMPSLYRTEEVSTIQSWGASTGKENFKFVYWVTEMKTPRIPLFAEVQEEVRQAWITEEARKLALAAAREKAEKARKAGSLVKAFPDAKQTNNFTWMNAPNMMLMQYGGGLQLNQDVENVESPGNDFMEAVFALEPNEFGVAWNNSHSIVYVVEVKAPTGEAEEGDTERITAFLEKDAPIDMPAVSLHRYAMNRYLTDWREQLEREMDIEWKREISQDEE